MSEREIFEERKSSLADVDFETTLPESAMKEIKEIAELTDDEEFVRKIRPVLRGVVKEIRHVEGERVRADKVVYHMLPSPSNPEKENPLVVMPSRGCGYEKSSGGCSMCNFGCEGREATKEDADRALDIIFGHNRKWFEKHPKDNWAIVNINAPGSFFSNQELSPEVRDYIYRKIKEYKEGEAKEKNVLMVTEARLDQITEEKLKEMREKLGPEILIDIGVGIESTDLTVEEGIFNKGKPDNWPEKMKMMKKYGTNVTPHLMFGAPFLTEEQAINDTVKSLKDCLGMEDEKGEKIVDMALLMVMNRRPGTLIDYLARNGQYQLPDILTVAEIVQRLGEELSPEDFKKIMVLGLVGPENLVEAGTEYLSCHDKNCRCSAVLDVFRKWRGTQENLRELSAAVAAVTDDCPSKKSYQGPYKRRDGLSAEDKKEIRQKAVSAYYKISRTVFPDMRGKSVKEVANSFKK